MNNGQGIIPDAVANRVVVDNELIPRFKQNDIYGGLQAGTQVLMGLAAQEFTAQAYQQKACKKKDEGGGGGGRGEGFGGGSFGGGGAGESC